MRLTPTGINRVIATGLLDQLNEGSIEIYAGARLERPDAPLKLQIRLVTLPLPAFSEPVSGSTIGRDIGPASIDVTGEARFALLLAPDGERIADLTVNTPDAEPSADLHFARTDFHRGGDCRIDLFALTLSGVSAA
jgi:hypothetical protein